MFLRLPLYHPIPTEFNAPARNSLTTDIKSLLSLSHTPKSPKSPKSPAHLPPLESPRGGLDFVPAPPASSAARSPRAPRFTSPKSSPSHADISLRTEALERHGSTPKGSLSVERLVQEAKSLCALGIVCENSFDLRGAVNAYRKMLMGAQKAQEMLRSSLERAMAESLHPEDAANKPIDAVLCAENLLAAALLRSGQLEDAYSQCLMYISHCGTDYAPIGHTNALLCQMALGHMDTALEHAEQAVNAAEDNQDLLMIWTCCGNAALVRFHRHEFHEAAAAMERSFEVSKLLRRRDLEAVSLYLWGQMLREAGRLAEAAAKLEEALALARKVEAKELATIAGMSLGIAKGELAYAELCSVSTKQSSP